MRDEVAKGEGGKDTQKTDYQVEGRGKKTWGKRKRE